MFLLRGPCLVILDRNKSDLESESRVQMSGGRCVCPPNGKTGETKEAWSTDQVLLWGVGVLHSLVIVVSCPVMTRSSSTENHYPGCVMEIADV